MGGLRDADWERRREDLRYSERDRDRDRERERERDDIRYSDSARLRQLEPLLSTHEYKSFRSSDLAAVASGKGYRRDSTLSSSELASLASRTGYGGRSSLPLDSPSSSRVSSSPLARPLGESARSLLSTERERDRDRLSYGSDWTDEVFARGGSYGRKSSLLDLDYLFESGLTQRDAKRIRIGERESYGSSLGSSEQLGQSALSERELELERILRLERLQNEKRRLERERDVLTNERVVRESPLLGPTSGYRYREDPYASLTARFQATRSAVPQSPATGLERTLQASFRSSYGSQGTPPTRSAPTLLSDADLLALEKRDSSSSIVLRQNSSDFRRAELPGGRYDDRPSSVSSIYRDSPHLSENDRDTPHSRFRIASHDGLNGLEGYERAGEATAREREKKRGRGGREERGIVRGSLAHEWGKLGRDRADRVEQGGNKRKNLTGKGGNEKDGDEMIDEFGRTIKRGDWAGSHEGHGRVSLGSHNRERFLSPAPRIRRHHSTARSRSRSRSVSRSLRSSRSRSRSLTPGSVFDSPRTKSPTPFSPSHRASGVPRFADLHDQPCRNGRTMSRGDIDGSDGSDSDDSHYEHRDRERTTNERGTERAGGERGVTVEERWRDTGDAWPQDWGRYTEDGNYRQPKPPSRQTSAHARDDHHTGQNKEKGKKSGWLLADIRKSQQEHQHDHEHHSRNSIDYNESLAADIPSMIGRQSSCDELRGDEGVIDVEGAPVAVKEEIPEVQLSPPSSTREEDGSQAGDRNDGDSAEHVTASRDTSPPGSPSPTAHHHEPTLQVPDSPHKPHHAPANDHTEGHPDHIIEVKGATERTNEPQHTSKIPHPPASVQTQKLHVAEISQPPSTRHTRPSHRRASADSPSPFALEWVEIRKQGLKFMPQGSGPPRKDEIYEGIERYDTEIARTEKRLEQLKAHAEKESALDAPSQAEDVVTGEQIAEPERPRFPFRKLSSGNEERLIDELMRENQQTSAKAHRSFAGKAFPKGYDTSQLPLYQRVQDAPGVAEAKDTHEMFRKTLQRHLCIRRTRLRRKELRLKALYNKLKEPWDRKQRLLEYQNPNRDLDRRNFFEREFPGQEKSDRFQKFEDNEEAELSMERLFYRGLPPQTRRRPGELSWVDKRLMEEFDIDKREYTATIPGMILDPWAKRVRFDNRNIVVRDMPAMHEQYKHSVSWSEEEKQIFLERYLETPKDFHSISTYLPCKELKDVVAFYYQCKKKYNLKFQVLAYANRKKRLAQLERMRGDALDSQDDRDYRRRRKKARRERLASGESMDFDGIAAWDADEMAAATNCILKYGRDWGAMAREIGTKSEAQCRNFYVYYKRRLNLDSYLDQYNRTRAREERERQAREEEARREEARRRAEAKAAAAAAEAAEGGPKAPGQLPKPSTLDTPNRASTPKPNPTTASGEPKKRKRGRPPKHVIVSDSDDDVPLLSKVAPSPAAKTGEKEKENGAMVERKVSKNDEGTESEQVDVMSVDDAGGWEKDREEEWMADITIEQWEEMELAGNAGVKSKYPPSRLRSGRTITRKDLKREAEAQEMEEREQEEGVGRSGEKGDRERRRESGGEEESDSDGRRNRGSARKETEGSARIRKLTKVHVTDSSSDDEAPRQKAAKQSAQEGKKDRDRTDADNGKPVQTGGERTEERKTEKRTKEQAGVVVPPAKEVKEESKSNSEPAAATATPDTEAVPVKKKRGRKRKYPDGIPPGQPGGPPAPPAPLPIDPNAPIKRKRGRPRKYPLPGTLLPPSAPTSSMDTDASSIITTASGLDHVFSDDERKNGGGKGEKGGEEKEGKEGKGEESDKHKAKDGTEKKDVREKRECAGDDMEREERVKETKKQEEVKEPKEKEEKTKDNGKEVNTKGQETKEKEESTKRLHKKGANKQEKSGKTSTDDKNREIEDEDGKSEREGKGNMKDADRREENGKRERERQRSPPIPKKKPALGLATKDGAKKVEGDADALSVEGSQGKQQLGPAGPTPIPASHPTSTVPCTAPADQDSDSIPPKDNAVPPNTSTSVPPPISTTAIAGAANSVSMPVAGTTTAPGPAQPSLPITKDAPSTQPTATTTINPVMHQQVNIPINRPIMGPYARPQVPFPIPPRPPIPASFRAPTPPHMPRLHAGSPMSTYGQIGGVVVGAAVGGWNTMPRRAMGMGLLNTPPLMGPNPFAPRGPGGPMNMNAAGFRGGAPRRMNMW